jgi:hypothetical protein
MPRLPFELGSVKPGEKKKTANRQEKRWAEKVHGKRQPASGALWNAKGDVKEHFTALFFNFLWDNKYTAQKAFKLSSEIWAKIRDEAYRKEGGYLPGLQVELRGHGISYLPDPLRLVVIEEDDFLAMKEQAEQNCTREGET